MKLSPAALSLGLSAAATALGVVDADLNGLRRFSRSAGSAKPTRHANDDARRALQTTCSDLDSKACKNTEECEYVKSEKSCNALPTPPPTNGPTAPPSVAPPPPPTKAPTGAPTRSPLPEGIGYCSDDAGRACWTAEACDCSSGEAATELFDRRGLQDAPCACLGLATDGPTKAPTQPPTSDPDRNSPTTSAPTDGPTSSPTKSPTGNPTKAPTQPPTNGPTTGSTGSPTWDPKGDPFKFYSHIAESFFDDYNNLEASGIDVAPDGSHLVVVSDDGEFVILNLRDYESGHCVLNSIKGIKGDDLEGVAFDKGAWSPDDMHVYVVHEGADDDAPMLYKVYYEYDPDDGSCKASVAKSENIKGAIPCLETSNGIESLGVKSHSSDGQEAVFLVGVQDTGRVYEVTAGGESNSQDRCYDGGLGDVAGSTYSIGNGHLWSYYEDENSIAVIDVDQACVVATYKIGSKLDEEGLAVDWERNLLYVAVDGQGKSSVVSVYNFSYPVGLDECEDSVSSCGGFDLC